MAPHPSFDDLIDNNRRYAEQVASQEPFDGIAHAGLAMITCMDSRIEPLQMLGLKLGDAKILRTPGGQLTPDAMTGCILGVQMLGVIRIMIVPHTRCAMAGGDEAIRAQLRETNGLDLGELAFGAVTDQHAKLRRDVGLLRAEPLVAGLAEVAGFFYDVDTGLLTRVI